MKYVIIFAFIGIVGSLGAALFFMMKTQVNGKAGEQKMAWALALRVGLSIVLFVSLLLAWKLGYLHPTGISAGQ